MAEASTAEHSTYISSSGALDTVPVPLEKAAAASAGVQDIQQQQQVFLAAARQDTKQGRKSYARAAAAAAGSRASQRQQPRASQHAEAAEPHSSPASSNVSMERAQGPAGQKLDAWQQQQEQWQEQWQQQQQAWQQQVQEQLQPAASGDGCEGEAGSQQQVEQEFSLCARPQQQQQHDAARGAADNQHVAEEAMLRRSGGNCGVQSDTIYTAAADSDDFGDFQGSLHAAQHAATDSCVDGVAPQQPAAAEARADDISGLQAAGAEAAGGDVQGVDRSSIMSHSTVSQVQEGAAASATERKAATPEAAAEALLAEGNTAYTAGKYSTAVTCYAKALDSLGGSIAATSSEAGVLLWIKCSLNLACCHLRLGQFKQCVALCDGLLDGEQCNSWLK
jgi:tetratricopeptide (TPR) repeat protein